MTNRMITLLVAAAAALSGYAATEIDGARYGLRPGTGRSMTRNIERALSDIKARHGGRAVTLRLAPGRYDFYPEKQAERTYYISNHDQDNPKSVGIAIEGLDSLTIEGSGADLMFHGRMLPVAITGSRGCTLRNLHIDFAEPHITQITIDSVTAQGTVLTVAPWANIRLDSKGTLEAYGKGWSNRPRGGIAFEGDTRHVVFNTGDIGAPLDSLRPLGKRTYLAPRWRDRRLQPGTVVALRTWMRPAPGIFLSECVNPTLENVSVHYAEGMGLLAQLCDSVTLDHFNVSLRGADDPRYFTTQADATHFSGCKGKITSVNGLYEGMMDDAINIHGTYLKIVGREGDRTLTGEYMHDQSYGFKWGEPGDTVSFVASRTMEVVGGRPTIESIEPIDAPTALGAKQWKITLSAPLPADIDPTKGDYGIENLTWTPEVLFAGNTVRNNRARGALFSTPRRTVVEDNLFDHTSGTAILLCGDCNGWYETGACRDVTIRRNRFVNALTSLYQFTNAVISIYPEIPDLEGQRTCFHGGPGTPGVVITDNDFESFDAPLLYAKSIDGLQFTGNRIKHTTAYKPYHFNRFNVLLEHTRHVTIADNASDTPLSVEVE